MRKLLFATSATILALSIVGCDSLPFLGGGDQPSPSPEASPSPTAETPASPSPAPTQDQSFPSPDVPPKPPGTDLIQSSSPEDRVSRLERELEAQRDEGQGTPLITLGPETGRDPFSRPNIPIPAPTEIPTPIPTPIPAPINGGGNRGVGGNGRDTGPVETTVVTRLSRQQVPQLPELPELTRPPQVGGVQLAGDIPPIRLSPLEERLVQGFRTVDALTDETSQLPEYTTDLSDLVGMSLFDRGVRREVLFSNRALYRRLEKTYGEYQVAARLWRIYGDESEPDALRCSSIPAIEQAIRVYQVPTIVRGQVRCARRIDMLEAVWRRGNNILDEALRDRDFNAPSLADLPSLPDAGEPKQLAVLPKIPEIQAPQPPRAITLGTDGRPAQPIPTVPPLATRPKSVPNLPELPVDEAPPRWRDPNPPPPPITVAPASPPPPPPPPSTDLARGIEVTGVLEVGNAKQAIVKAPNEATSRYVKEGQLIANGKVLVKRIEFEQGEAIVVLEENGVEVRKRVGETFE